MYTVDNKYIDGKMSYLKFDSVKGLRNYHVSPNIEVRSKVDNCIFLSQPIYKLYCSSEEYVAIVMDILKTFHNNFDIVYFNPHPRDHLSVLKLIKSNVEESNMKNVIFLKENSSAEMLPNKYDFSHSVSFSSTSLLNLKQYYGIEPVYLYHLISFLKDNKNMIANSFALSKTGYKFIDSFGNISPKYKSNLCISSNTLSKVIKF